MHPVVWITASTALRVVSTAAISAMKLSFWTNCLVFAKVTDAWSTNVRAVRFRAQIAAMPALKDMNSTERRDCVKTLYVKKTYVKTAAWTLIRVRDVVRVSISIWKRSCVSTCLARLNSATNVTEILKLANNVPKTTGLTKAATSVLMQHARLTNVINVT